MKIRSWWYWNYRTNCLTDAATISLWIYSRNYNFRIRSYRFLKRNDRATSFWEGKIEKKIVSHLPVSKVYKKKKGRKGREEWESKEGKSYGSSRTHSRRSDSIDPLRLLAAVTCLLLMSHQCCQRRLHLDGRRSHATRWPKPIESSLPPPPIFLLYFFFYSFPSFRQLVRPRGETWSNAIEFLFPFWFPLAFSFSSLLSLLK